MGIDLRMEPYAEMFETERPESRIIDELCFPDITDKLCDRLGLSWMISIRPSTKRAACRTRPP